MPFKLFPKSGTEKDKLFGTRSHGIDLRLEYDLMVNGSESDTGNGYWVVLRHFDLTKFAEPYNRATGTGVYNQITKEGIGDNIHPYTNTAIRVMSKDQTTGAARYVVEQVTPVGSLPISYRTFYIGYNILATEADIIYEINYEGIDAPPASVIIPPYKQKWDILEITPMRGDGGRIEYYAAIAGKSFSKSES